MAKKSSKPKTGSPKTSKPKTENKSSLAKVKETKVKHVEEPEEIEEEVSEELEEETSSSPLRYIRIVAVMLIIVILVALMAFNTPSTKQLDDVWDEATTQGNLEAKHHYVMYTDIMCPYCDYFSRAIMADQEAFEQYIAENDILFEVRVTDFLYEYNGVSEHSTRSAEGAYCAKREGKFWEYYHAALTALNNDYHSKGIGNSKTSPAITDMTTEYWKKIGHDIGLGDSFDSCYENHEALSEVRDNTSKTAKALQKEGQGGLPFFKFNNYTTSGFDPSWDWSYVRMLFDAGLNQK